MDFSTSQSTAPGRVRSYQNQVGEKKLTPHSCSLRVYKNNLWDMLRLVSQDLRGGSGVKLILDDYVDPEPCEFQWSFFLSEKHPDFSKITEHQKKFFHKFTDFFTDWHSSRIYVSDSMEEAKGVLEDSIEESWLTFIELARQGKSIIVDLSELRPNGSVNGQGLTATGAVGDGSDFSNESSFLAIYEYLAAYLQKPSILRFIQLFGVLNGTLRRGGLYKNGIVTSSMDYRNPLIREYLNAPLIDIPGSHKKGVRVDQHVLADKELVSLICEKRNTESVFLAKIQPEGIYENVCQAIFMQDAGTCLIWRVNLAQCQPYELVGAFIDATVDLCNLHVSWRNEVGDRAKNYRPLTEDRQIGLDVLGLANALSIWGITYQEFADALESYLEDGSYDDNPVAFEVVDNLCQAYAVSTEAADRFMDSRGRPRLDRIHTVEPSQSHSFECKDLRGFTTARSIFPPIARKQKRESQSQKVKIYNYGNVETLVEIGSALHQRVCELWQRMMERFGRAHGISFDTIEECTEDWFTDWLLRSPLQTAYYQEYQNFDQSYLAKKVSTPALEAVQCSIENKEHCTICEE